MANIMTGQLSTRFGAIDVDLLAEADHHRVGGVA
jgi:hypothetical protein